MSETENNTVPPEVLHHMMVEQVMQNMRANYAFDVPRQWANTVTLTLDDQSKMIILTFREAINFTVKAEEGQETPQNLSRNVASIVLPKGVVEEFLKGATEYLASQEAENG